MSFGVRNIFDFIVIKVFLVFRFILKEDICVGYYVCLFVEF